MGVYIKGMEMPKSCDECRIMIFEDTNFVPELFCGCPIVFKARPQGVGHRPDYCPLVEVPEHGRLIGADALLESIKEAKKKQPEISDVYDEDYFAVAEWVSYAPTIIESEGD